MNLKLSKFGAFIGCSNYPTCKHTRPLIGGDDDMAAAEEDRDIGVDPRYQIPIVLKRGPYGHYFEWMGEIPKSPEELLAIAEKEAKKAKRKSAAPAKAPKAPKPKRVSLPADVAPADATLELAMQLEKLPYQLGMHPDDQMPISVGYGRFGPYVKYADIFASIPKAMDFLNVTLAEAVDLIAKKKARPARGRGGSKVVTDGKSLEEIADAVLPKGRKAAVKKAPDKKAAVKKAPAKKPAAVKKSVKKTT
jgi:DNA topoisomerase-1